MIDVLSRRLERISQLFFFFNDTATTEIYTLSLHDALPICPLWEQAQADYSRGLATLKPFEGARAWKSTPGEGAEDRKSTRLNSSHSQISYAVFCLKKKNRTPQVGI